MFLTSPDDNLNSNSNVAHLLLELFIVFTIIVARCLLELWEEARAADNVPKHLQRRVVGIYRGNSSEERVFFYVVTPEFDHRAV